MKSLHKKEFQQIASNNFSEIEFKDFMKLYNDYTKEPYLISVNDTTLWSVIYQDLVRIYYKNNF